MDLMRRVAEKRQTTLIVTHEMQFAREIADRIVFMDAGRIVEQGTPAKIPDAPPGPPHKGVPAPRELGSHTPEAREHR